MSWIDRKTFGAVAALLAGALPGTALADALVVRAVGPSVVSYKPGQKLPDTAAIVLRAGDQLTVLDKGGTRTLRGPGKFTAAAAVSPAATTATTVAYSALTGVGLRRARVGAVRSGEVDGPPPPTNLWFVDASKGGKLCLVDGSPVSLWRPDPGKAASVTVSGGAKPATLAFPVGQSQVAWPGAAPGRYQLKQGAVVRAIEVEKLPAMPADLMGLADTLIAHGCTAQLDHLVATAGG